MGDFVKMIIDSDYDTLTIMNKEKKIIIRNINEYNLMKYNEFKGERIIKQLNDYCKVEESFNDGVFNILIRGKKLQSHNKIEVCKRLKLCENLDTIDPLIELFQDEIKSELNKIFFEQVLEPFRSRIEINDEQDIIIDKVFKVDKNGQAYYLNANDKFNHLCIVAGSPKFKHMINHAIGKFSVDFRTIEIYYKILFLLYPNKEDSVFYNQLPKKLREMVDNGN